jgi:hypothetical protein
MLTRGAHSASGETRPAVRPERPRVRVATFDDYVDIAAVETANGLAAKTQEEWRHLWTNNPVYQRLRDWPIGWVLEDREGHVVGSIGNVPLEYHLDGRAYLCATGRAWAVDPQYRGFSLALLAPQIEQRNVDLFLATTANRTTAALYSRLGWRRVPAGEWDRAAVWVTNYARTVPRYLAATAPGPVSALAGVLLYPPLLLRDLLSRRRQTRRTGCDLQWSAGFDARFDELWRDLLERNPRLLLSTRTADTLNWHFKPALDQNRLWILTACRDRRLIGYTIFERRDSRAFDVRRMLLIDSQAPPEEHDLPSAMLEMTLDRCRREGIDVLENTGCWFKTRRPFAARPRYRGLESWCYLFQPGTADLAGALQSAAPWAPTQFDGDASL